ncbi:MAG: HPr family phosphocarrier protein [Oscillospiraceae bacterium]|jgi:phosphocarrier protein|nr:HPr family phosphocarrier protein [Oscillospiraceae bacterium]MCI1990403.1 HPr family phosphocarrier protein [Oscillospiraceae bacterium]MCI2035943.1 HPr family phosphocarrier protein [Oscillospiraceae bacterium]
MYKKTVTIQNATGLHARPASDFIALAAKFKSYIVIRRKGGDEDDDANAKSIVNVLSLGLAQGEEVEIEATGDDEKKAVDSLVDLINSKFGE